MHATHLPLRSHRVSPSPCRWDDALSALNAAFTAVFVLEMILKFIAVGIPAYFSDVSIPPVLVHSGGAVHAEWRSNGDSIARARLRHAHS